jgi:hypothetical protein
MIKDINTYELNGLQINECAKCTAYHLVYDDDGLIHYLAEEEITISTSQNLFVATTQSEVADKIDSNLLYFDSRSEISDDCLKEFFN